MGEEKQPRVLVGSPVSSYKKQTIEDYLEGLRNLSYKNKEILLLDNSPDEELFKELKKEPFLKVEKTEHIENVREMVKRDRNTLRERVLNGGFDYFLSLEQDVVPPKNCIETLLSRKKPVCGGVTLNVYQTKKGRESLWELLPATYTWAVPTHKEIGLEKRMSFADIFPSRLTRVKGCGLACVLIHRPVLEKIEFRLMKESPAYDDSLFHHDCDRKGIDVWLDSSVVCRHIISPLQGKAKEEREAEAE